MELGIKHLVVASLTGRSCLRLVEEVERRGADLSVVCVTFRAGGWINVERLLSEVGRGDTWVEIPELYDYLLKSRERGDLKIPYLASNPAIMKALEERGVRIVITTDLGMDIDSSLEVDLGIATPRKLMSMMLLLFSSGMKVAFYAVLSAADAGAIPVDREVIAMGGTELGLDTAIVVKPSYSDDVFNRFQGFEVREIICKPRSMMVGSEYLERRYYAPRQ